MKAFSRFISHHPKSVLLIGLVILVPALISAELTPINYDIFSYMPKHVEAVKGQLIMKDEYNSAGTGFILLETTDVPKILEVKDGIAAIEGVSDVNWISDVVDPSVPETFIPPEILGIYQKKGHALLHISFEHAAASDETIAAVYEIKDFLANVDSTRALTGLPVLVQELRVLVNQEKVRAIIAAVVISAILVGVAMGSWAVPLIFLSAIGIGIVYNLGTNFIQGSISYVTEAVAAVIQLGVTFDFSIFLTHRFREETMRCENKEAAMEKAIHSTFSAIFPAALTTIAGFLALCLMEIGIGADMGIVMSKGVFLGMITSVTILPAMLLIFHEHINIRDIDDVAVRHQGVSQFLAKHAPTLSIVFLLIFIPAVYGRFHTELSYNINDMLPQGMPAIESIETIESVMGDIEMAYVVLPEDTPRQAISAIADWSVPGFGSSDCSCDSHLFGMLQNPVEDSRFIDILLEFRINRLEKQL